MTRRHLLPFLVSAALVGGCGGDDEPATNGDQPAPGGTASGEQLFSSTCGGCHTLSAAGTTGVTGPSLDELQPDRDRVLQAIETGPGPMPAGLLGGAEAEAVADYVSENAGG